MRRIGILGGTFDPPHIGHLIIAEEVRIALNLEEIWFIPSYEPPHKQKATINAKDRVRMLEWAVEGNPNFKINSIELERLGKSYTFDTIHSIKKKYPSSKFYFIVGADMVEYLPNWHRIDDLIKLVTFVGVKRQGFQLNTTYPIIEVDAPMIDISSTLIRNRLENKESVNYLVPKSVHTYIKENHLYEN